MLNVLTRKQDFSPCLLLIIVFKISTGTNKKLELIIINFGDFPNQPKLTMRSMARFRDEHELKPFNILSVTPELSESSPQLKTIRSPVTGVQSLQ